MRIAVKAAGINFADTMARVGLYPDAPKPPCVLGYEVAGEVESVGEGVSDFGSATGSSPAPASAARPSSSPFPRRRSLPLPERLSFEQGAAFPVNYGTAYAALVLMGSLREGDRVLIHAAAGGVGIAATQIARNAGAEIFGTASPSKHEAIRAQGVDHPIDYRNQDFEAEVMRITGGEGVDLIIDALGPTSFRKDYRLLRPGGRLVMYGLSEGTKEGKRDLPAMLQSLVEDADGDDALVEEPDVMNENKGVFGLNMLKWWDREGNLDRVTEPLMADLEAGRLEPVVAEAFPFERAGDAHDSSPSAATSARSCCFLNRTLRTESGRSTRDEEGDSHHARDLGGAGAACPPHADELTYTVLLAGGASRTDPDLADPDGRSYVIDSIVPLEVGGTSANTPGNPNELVCQAPRSPASKSTPTAVTTGSGSPATSRSR